MQRLLPFHWSDLKKPVKTKTVKGRDMPIWANQAEVESRRRNCRRSINSGTNSNCRNTHTSDEGVQQQVVSDKVPGQDIRCHCGDKTVANTETSTTTILLRK